ncbi:MAG: 4-alpha-glucanotransferase, partial [Candidatus Heimdallarchaeota archaeon]
MTTHDEKAKNYPFSRAGGILLHPTCLPSISGIGDIGKPAKKFIDLLKKYKQRLWQILPLGPTGYGESPYSCLSAFAGNPLLISFDHLREFGLLDKSDYVPDTPFNEHRVEYENVIPYKWSVLRKSYNTYKTRPDTDLELEFKKFEENNRYWLEDFVLYFALKMAHNKVSWLDWPEAYRTRDPSALDKWREKHLDEINFHRFIQFLFFKQWKEVKTYAHQCNIIV